MCRGRAQRISVKVEEIDVLEDIPDDVDLDDAKSEDTESEEEDKNGDNAVAEVYRTRWLAAEAKKRDLESLVLKLEKQRALEESIRKTKGKEKREEDRRAQVAHVARYQKTCFQRAEPTRGDLPAYIGTHIRLPKKTKCLAELTFRFIGKPYPPLKRSELITFIEHFGGRYIPLGSANATTSYLVVGMDPDNQTMENISKHKIGIITQQELLDKVKDHTAIIELRKRGIDVDQHQQQPSPKRRRELE